MKSGIQYKAQIRMKKIILCLMLLISGWSFAQSGLTTNENYSYAKSCLTEDCSKKVESVQYFDGLARPKQTISIKGTPSGKDVVQHIVYDPTGITNKTYLPVPQSVTQDGGIYTDPLANASQIYGLEKIFGVTTMDIAPYNRVKQSVKPGNAWANKPVQYNYGTNAANEVLKFTASTIWENNATKTDIVKAGYYPVQKLSKNTVTNEDGNTSIEFKSASGKTLLVKKVISASESINTYYIYNEYNQLAFVLSPEASKAIESTANGTSVSQSTRDLLCYQYRYDSKGRQVEKKLPGKGWEYFVYDKADRLIMTQDAELGKKGKWFFSKYDRLGRVVYTGIADIGAQFIRDQVQRSTYDYIDQGKPWTEERNTTGFTNSGMTVYYGNTAYPTTIDKVLSINYYDTYPTGTPARPTQILGVNTISDNTANAVSTRSLPTASYVKNIEDDNWTKSYIWYDDKTRPIGTHSINHLGGYTKTESLLDFAGIPQQSKVYHKRLNADTEKIITQTYEYDSGNRLKKQWHQVGTGPQELLAENTYNELNQLSGKKVGNNIQDIVYTYNILGALTKVNDPASLNGKLFAYELKYQNPVNASVKYNGNITETDWRTTSDNILRRYTYSYDALNRLTKGTYSEPGSSVPQNGFFNETIAYDNNSNITSLQRNGKSFVGTSELIDNLTYSYTGNKLNSVNDASGNYSGYPDVSGNNITYDDNGSMKDHVDKGILQIDYNFLNLPDYVKFDKTYIPRLSIPDGKYNVNTRYLYRSDGTKLKKTYQYGSADSNTETYTITEYLDGFQYESTASIFKPTSPLTLKFVPTSEGYYNFENNKYIYSYTDHLGNVRLSYAKNGLGTEIIEENNYYPFGLKHQGYNQLSGNPAYNYQYNGKELQKETGWSDYGARMYMSDIGRWGVIDPLSETSRRLSPYNYAVNNPINFIDPDGRKSIYAPAMDPERSVGFGERGGLLRYYASGGHGGVADYLEYLGQQNGTATSLLIAMSKLNIVGGGDSQTFGETQEYKDIMAYLNTGSNPKPTFWKRVGNFFSSLFGGNKGTKATAGAWVVTDIALIPDGVVAAETATTATAGTLASTGLLTFGAVLFPTMAKDPAIPIVMPADMVNDQPSEFITLYRGVYNEHPDYMNALKGEARPYSLSGHDDPERHNGGDFKSLFTSWTLSLGVANYNANKNGPGGVVLIKQIPLNHTVPSPDHYDELEVLIPGVVRGATVIAPTGPGSPRAF
ncbi:DUF6443 domain-containing protein [Chryseobacterium paridis]|uniref:RHS repeat-associated core domain-containing protein n=1 Tax=Chryseobacterium paridis TaxID=2800328 RepID=A0ABS1FT73_9FLAO|nr:DUF6443 domain-containing protein [Chryseobacterium paridis]MBK1895626.1 RHS repeat-associated core domain-containing protein [Chryseobacterium paridis]